MNQADTERRIADIRRFNRFYTQKIGVLDEQLLDGPYSLAEARVLYELANRTRPTAAEIAQDLRLDPGYLSRILRGFRRQGLLCDAADSADRRRRTLSLTEAGAAAFAPLDNASRREIAGLLRDLPEPAQSGLAAAMQTIERLLGTAEVSAAPAIMLRPHQPGDLGWIVSRHGALYAREYGWDVTFEGMVADIAARLLENFNPTSDRCWLAERNGERLGSIALVRENATTARLRLLLVDPTARGEGLGHRLVNECLAFARSAGYRRIVLSTYGVLAAARHLYEIAGFRIARTEPCRAYGHNLVEEDWALDLA
jgi:DNA-binding MarR family transcriptional regulator/N-acetylglutamate synthase-like GNAT family acetyltransferase